MGALGALVRTHKFPSSHARSCYSTGCWASTVDWYRVLQVVHMTVSPSLFSGMTGMKNRVNHRLPARCRYCRSAPHCRQWNMPCPTVRHQDRSPKMIIISAFLPFDIRPICTAWAFYHALAGRSQGPVMPSRNHSNPRHRSRTTYLYPAATWPVM